MTKSFRSVYGQLYTPAQTNTTIFTNRYNVLYQYSTDDMDSPIEQNVSIPVTSPKPKDKLQNETLWVNDTGIARLSEVIIHQLDIDRQTREESGDATISPTPQYEDPSFQTIPTVPQIQHMRFNLIRRRDTTCDITTLKLFKSFTTVLREIDNEINILPYETNKNHISPLTNARQINNVDDNKLKLYFRPYHKKQLYSLSGYFNVGTTLSADALFHHAKMMEWLDSHRYYIKLSPSQSEEMVQIGALLFSSIYMYRADLKLSIITHPLWQPKDTENPPIFELFTSDLIAADKKARMIFVSAEKTKADEVSTLFRTIYDGKAKEYPNGAMMLFIPMNEDTQYTSDYRKKLIFNHDSFIGTEDAITLNGLHNLNNIVTLKNGDKIKIRMLLKSLPASQGMSRPQLFQFVEPNNSGITTLATFQVKDKEHVLKRKDSIESELRAIVSPADIDKLFITDTEGLWSGGIFKNKGGKIIPNKVPNQHTQQHISQISSILHSPPKKRDLPTISQQPQPQAPSNKYHYTVTATPTNPHLTQPSLRSTPESSDRFENSPIIAQIDHRFSIIEETIQQHQEYNENFHLRLLNLEKTTNNTDAKIDMILNKMDTFNNPAKQRKVSFHPTINDQDCEMLENHHPNSQQQQQYPGCDQQCLP
jgi:hypothetical protein